MLVAVRTRFFRFQAARTVKKLAKSHNIHKPKRLESTEHNILGVQNRLNPGDLKLRMVPNINIALLLVQGATKTDYF